MTAASPTTAVEPVTIYVDVGWAFGLGGLLAAGILIAVWLFLRRSRS